MNCQICGEKFTKLKDLIRHGIGERHRYTHMFCTPCALSFDCVTDVIEHISSDEHVIIALATNFRFDTNSEDSYTIGPSFPPHSSCFLCGFRSFLPIDEHCRSEDHIYVAWVLRTILKSKEIQCSNREADVSTQDFLSRMINAKQGKFTGGVSASTTHGSLPYTCEFCNVQFYKPRAYSQHMDNQSHKIMEKFIIKVSEVVENIEIIGVEPNTKISKTFGNSLPSLYYCEVCCLWVDTLSMYIQHRRCSRHKSNEITRINRYASIEEIGISRRKSTELTGHKSTEIAKNKIHKSIELSVNNHKNGEVTGISRYRSTELTGQKNTELTQRKSTELIEHKSNESTNEESEKCEINVPKIPSGSAMNFYPRLKFDRYKRNLVSKVAKSSAQCCLENKNVVSERKNPSKRLKSSSSSSITTTGDVKQQGDNGEKGKMAEKNEKKICDVERCSERSQISTLSLTSTGDENQQGDNQKITKTTEETENKTCEDENLKNSTSAVISMGNEKQSEDTQEISKILEMTENKICEPLEIIDVSNDGSCPPCLENDDSDSSYEDLKFAANNGSVEHYCEVCDFLSSSALHYEKHFISTHHRTMIKILKKKEEEVLMDSHAIDKNGEIAQQATNI